MDPGGGRGLGYWVGRVHFPLLQAQAARSAKVNTCVLKSAAGLGVIGTRGLIHRKLRLRVGGLILKPNRLAIFAALAGHK